MVSNAPGVKRIEAKRCGKGVCQGTDTTSVYKPGKSEMTSGSSCCDGHVAVQAWEVLINVYSVT